LSKLDRREEAEKSLAELISATKINSAEALRAQLDWVMPSSAESNEQLINALKNVGLPE
jgi:hypothetical protein